MQVIKFKKFQFICCRCLQTVRKTASRTAHRRRMTFNLITAYVSLLFIFVRNWEISAQF